MVADVSVRDINRVFDEGLLPSRFLRHAKGRRMRSDACAFVSFYFRTADDLTADARSRVIRVMAGPGAPPVYSDEIMTVSLERFTKDASKRHAVLQQAKAMVVEDPDILAGTPVLRGTRIPVHDIAAAARAGASRERLLAAYPNLDAATIELAKVYADASPPRGRPRALGELRPELTLVTRHKVARRRRE